MRRPFPIAWTSTTLDETIPESYDRGLYQLQRALGIRIRCRMFLEFNFGIALAVLSGAMSVRVPRREA